jgi:hypothetical protein
MRSYVKPWKTFFSYPFTWAAAGLMIAATMAFIVVLQPGLLWLLAVLGADAAGLALWFVMAFKSKHFQKRLNRMPYEDRGKEVETLVRDCPEEFRRPALESLTLIRRITSEFAGRAYRLELELMLSNIHHLAQSHRTLWSRSRQFGDRAQKEKMDAMLADQITAVNGALSTLRTFSGNLTLLEANEKHSRAATNQLKDINEGLKEVIKEL